MLYKAVGSVPTGTLQPSTRPFTGFSFTIDRDFSSSSTKSSLSNRNSSHLLSILALALLSSRGTVALMSRATPRAVGGMRAAALSPFASLLLQLITYSRTQRHRPLHQINFTPSKIDVITGARSEQFLLHEVRTWEVVLYSRVAVTITR